MITPCNYELHLLFLGNCDGVPDEGAKLVAVMVIFFVVFVNCASVKVTTNIVTFFGFGKVLSLIIIIIGGVVRICQGKYTGSDKIPSSDLEWSWSPFTDK